MTERKSQYRQDTIDSILASEHEMVVQGEKRFGAYCTNAWAFNRLLGTGMVKSVKADRFIFAIFLSQIKKHHTLALFSALRLHHVQAVMNLRQVLEAGACAAYAIANTDPADFVDAKGDGTLDPSKKLTVKRYAWLDNNFPDGSQAIKRAKEIINTLGAHANIVDGYHNFEPDLKKGQFAAPFFDYEDEVWVKTDLWQIANVGLGLMDLIYGVNKQVGAVTLLDTWLTQFREAAAENDRLKKEMMNHERFQKYF